MMLSALCMARAAQAAQPLIFDTPLAQRSALLISQHMNADIRALSVAAADLNGDGMQEFIVRPKTCALPDKFCPFSILAEADDGLIELGRIEARALAIGDKSTSGVRDILAQQERYNDYAMRVYAWDGWRSRYILKEE